MEGCQEKVRPSLNKTRHARARARTRTTVHARAHAHTHPCHDSVHFSRRLRYAARTRELAAGPILAMQPTPDGGPAPAIEQRARLGEPSARVRVPRRSCFAGANCRVRRVTARGQGPGGVPAMILGPRPFGSESFCSRSESSCGPGPCHPSRQHTERSSRLLPTFKFMSTYLFKYRPLQVLVQSLFFLWGRRPYDNTEHACLS